MAKRYTSVNVKFLLTDIALKGLLELVKEQSKSGVIGNEVPTEFFKAELKNGTTLELETVEALTKSDSRGGNAVKNLYYYYETSTIKIQVSFHTEKVDKNVTYSVEGVDEIWVSATFLLLGERIEQITDKSNYIERFLSDDIALFAMIFSSIFFIILGIVSFTQIPDRLNLANLQEIENEWRSGTITDTVEIILKLERAKISTNPLRHLLQLQEPRNQFWTGLIIFSIMGVFYGYSRLPKRAFYWGAQVTEIDKKSSQGKFIINFIIGGIILTLVLNLLSNWLSTI